MPAETPLDLQRDARAARWIEDTIRDVRYALRSLARTPAFSTISVVTLALGIGATTAIFSVFNAVLIRPLPYPDADRLVRLVSQSPPGLRPAPRMNLRPTELVELRERSKTLSHAGISTLSFTTMTTDAGTVRLEGARVSPAIFNMRGVAALVGRVFDTQEEQAGAGGVIILSEQTWRRYFDGNPDVLGRIVSLDDVFASGGRSASGNRQYTVVGVMPAHFDADGGFQFWIPFALPSSAEGSQAAGGLSARLADGVTPAAAAAEVGEIVRALLQHPASVTYQLVRDQDRLVAPVRSALLVLMAAVVMVLLIACVNVTSLLLARNASRQREIAVRLSLGAARSRIVRQLITESLTLAVGGSIVGAALAFGGVRLLRNLASTLSRMDLGLQLPFPRLQEIQIDATALGSALALALACGVVCGLAPALGHSRTVRVEALRQGGSTASRGFSLRRRRGRALLVVAEVAMALVLLIGAGLLIRSFVGLATTDAGYKPGGVLTFQVGLPADRYSADRLKPFAEDLISRTRLIPGVRAAAYARQLPLVAIVESASFRRRVDAPAGDLSAWPPSNASADMRLVSHEYFDVLRIPIVSGRALRDDDGAVAPRVLVINETLARRDFPGEDPVGHIVYAGRDSVPWTIAGVSRDVRQGGANQPADPQFFADYRQWPDANGPAFTFLGPYYALRHEADDALVLSRVQDLVHRMDDQAGLFNVATMEQLVSNGISRPRLYAVLLGVFAVVAGVLAVIGLYGVMAYSVAQRTPEIGIRMALGAQRRQVLRLVLGQSFILTVSGIALGVAGALVTTRSLGGMLYGITPLDLRTFVGVSIVFAAAAMAAAWIPANRATKIDPLLAIRND
jgi:putative ABC transport system permease protein